MEHPQEKLLFSGGIQISTLSLNRREEKLIHKHPKDEAYVIYFNEDLILFEYSKAKSSFRFINNRNITAKITRVIFEDSIEADPEEVKEFFADFFHIKFSK